MAKRLSENQKKAIVQKFTTGYNIGQLSEEFNCTKLTISRHLKKNIDEEEYKNLVNKNRFTKQITNKNKLVIDENVINNEEVENKITNHQNKDKGEFFSPNTFIEIAPLDQEIDLTNQKDLSSIPIDEIKLPDVVYMIVDKQVELEIKSLKDYPDWHFLPTSDLERKIIEIFFDIKTAKRFCKKDQRVIKVPNTNVFKIVAPILVTRGISRIVTADRLISL